MPPPSFDTPAIFEALSRVCADVTSVKVVMGVNVGTAQSAIVAPLRDSIEEWPAIFLVPGPWSVIPGQRNARLTFTALGAIYNPRDDVGDSSVAVLRVWDLLFDAFAAHAKAYEPAPTLQSVLLTEGPGLSDAEWPPESSNWWLTWPFELEVKVNAAPFYQNQ